ncbi:MAG: hypothetical protein HQL30_12420 [Candidatus Omnitrophica bacterium]|nr:hypothetical protein [Candidatus Omnitrophota bacterium]
MGEFEKHMRIAKEKLTVAKQALGGKNNTVVGDLATKVVEQLIEADVSRKGEHFGDHKSRNDYSNKEYPEEVNNAMRRVCLLTEISAMMV